MSTDDANATDDDATEGNDQADADGANAETTPAEPLDEEQIRAWALAERNKERAKALGMRLITNQDPEKLQALDSLGDFEDRATAWAVENPGKARALILGLVPQLL